MSNRDLLTLVQSTEDLRKRRMQLEEKFKREEQRIKDRDKMLGVKLKSARTHMVMELTPQLVKALGYSHLLNISLEDIVSKDQLLEKLEGEKSFNAVFDDLENVMIALTDIIYNRPDLREELQKLITDMTGIPCRKEDGEDTAGQ